MENVQRCHEALLQQRTQIRHDAATHLWMKRCWLAVPHAEANVLSQDEFEDLYSILMYEMTICWEEELNDAILHKLWTRDAGSYTTLNFDRFCCSLFSFVEMWVEEITLAQYEKVFGHIYRTLSGHDQRHRYASASPERTFKPTLESFNNALDNEKAMEELQMSVGKSISFNAQQYYRHFGTPTTHLQAFQATLLHLQSRVLMDSNDVSERARSPSTESTASTASMLRRQLAHARRSRPLSPPRLSSSPPRPLRPVSSSAARASFVLAIDSESPTAAVASSPSPERLRLSGDAFIMTGKSVLKSPQMHAR